MDSDPHTSAFQRSLALAISRGRSIAAWARSKDVVVEKARGWAELPEFKLLVEKVRIEHAEQMVGKLARAAGGAIKQLVAVSKNLKHPAAAVAAAKAIIDKWVLISQHFIQSLQLQDLTARAKAIQAKRDARAGQMVGKAFRPNGAPAMNPAAAVPREVNSTADPFAPDPLLGAYAPSFMMPPPHGGLAAKKRNGIARVATRVPPPIRPHFQTERVRERSTRSVHERHAHAERGHETGPDLRQSGDNVMASQKQIAANRRNASKSAAARSEEARARIRFNALRHARRAQILILPGESRQDYDDCLDALTRSCRPRNEAEVRLLGRVVRAVWVADRAERVNELRIIELCEQENERAEIDVHKKMKRLFHDPRGPLALYGLTSAADGGPRTSSHEKPADDEKYDPFVLVKQIEASPMGCQKLAEQWGELRSRIEQGLGFQAPDRLRMIRMVGKSPVMAALDEVVAKIYVASFAIYPFGCKNAYEDLKADANDEEFKLLVERIRSRSPLVLDASDTAAARQFLLDLIDRNLERLEAKLEVHRQRGGIQDTKRGTRCTRRNARGRNGATTRDGVRSTRQAMLGLVLEAAARDGTRRGGDRGWR